MSYVPINWNELPPSNFSATPLSAENLNHMDQGIKRTHAQAMTNGQRDALTGPELFTGRTIFNTTVERFEIYIATAPTSGAAFTTPGWFRLPTYFDAVDRFANQVVEGIKTYTQPIVGTTKLIGAKVFRQNDLPITSNSFTLIPWTNTEFDVVPEMHLVNTTPTRLTVPVAGIYQIHLQVRWGGSLGSPYDLIIRKNSTDNSYSNVAHVPTSPSAEFSQSFTELFNLNANEFVEARIRSRNATQDVIGGLGTYMSIYRVGAL